VPRRRSGRHRSYKDSEARKRRRSCKGSKMRKGDRRGAAVAEAGVAAVQEERAPPHRPAQAAGTRTLCSVETCISKAG
jgi:hypothetical protein